MCIYRLCLNRHFCHWIPKPLHPRVLANSSALVHYYFLFIMSFVSDIMAPGGAVLLLPFIRAVVTVLLCCTLMVFFAGVARIHMAILSFLSAGLLMSLRMFEQAYNKVKGKGGDGAASPRVAPKADGKTD